MTMTTTILEVRDVTMRFGGLVANERVSMSVHGGEIFAVIGPNGAGKTTLFNAITGIYEATEGQILFDGKEIRREWSRRTSYRAIGIGLATAVVAVFAYNATDLWQGAIVEKYVYAKPFPWGRGHGDAGHHDARRRFLVNVGYRGACICAWPAWLRSHLAFAAPDARPGFACRDCAHLSEHSTLCRNEPC